MKTNPNTPAFPRIDATTNEPGMTLRQYYAGLAMQGLLAKYNLSNPEGVKTITQLSFEIADEMLEY